MISYIFILAAPYQSKTLKMIHWPVKWACANAIVVSAMKTYWMCTIIIATAHVRCNVAKISKCSCAIALAIWCLTPMKSIIAICAAWCVWTIITKNCRWLLHAGQGAKRGWFAIVCHRAQKLILPLCTIHGISNKYMILYYLFFRCSKQVVSLRLGKIFIQFSNYRFAASWSIIDRCHRRPFRYQHCPQNDTNGTLFVVNSILSVIEYKHIFANTQEY